MHFISSIKLIVKITFTLDVLIMSSVCQSASPETAEAFQYASGKSLFTSAKVLDCIVDAKTDQLERLRKKSNDATRQMHLNTQFDLLSKATDALSEGRKTYEGLGKGRGDAQLNLSKGFQNVVDDYERTLPRRAGNITVKTIKNERDVASTIVDSLNALQSIIDKWKKEGCGKMINSPDEYILFIQTKVWVEESSQLGEITWAPK